MQSRFAAFDAACIRAMREWSVPFLRIALGIVFVWFGGLKLFGVSPVANLIGTTYSFFPQDQFVFVLGIWEALIGLGLIFKIALRTTIALLLLQMAGTIGSFLLNPHLLFAVPNIILLTTEGEFVVKNFVLIAAALVIGGYEVKPKQ